MGEIRLIDAILSLSEHEPKALKSNNQYLTVENLKKYTNYSVTVLAHTKVGDGVRTRELFCRTSEDVPSSPASIKAIPASNTKVIVSWLPPTHHNGHIVRRQNIPCTIVL